MQEINREKKEHKTGPPRGKLVADRVFIHSMHDPCPDERSPFFHTKQVASHETLATILSGIRYRPWQETVSGTFS